LIALIGIDFGRVEHHPVMLTGQLFFDASHSPCSGKKKITQNEAEAEGIKQDPARGNPARMAVWGIHPVYAIEVCKSISLQQCKLADTQVWIPFDQLPQELHLQPNKIQPGVLKGTSTSCKNHQWLIVP